MLEKYDVRYIRTARQTLARMQVPVSIRIRIGRTGVGRSLKPDGDGRWLNVDRPGGHNDRLTAERDAGSPLAVTYPASVRPSFRPPIRPPVRPPVQPSLHCPQLKTFAKVFVLSLLNAIKHSMQILELPTVISSELLRKSKKFNFTKIISLYCFHISKLKTKRVQAE